MSPNRFNSGYARVFFVYSTGSLSNRYVNSTYGVRPVVNLRADIQLSGSGTASDPYLVVGA